MADLSLRTVKPLCTKPEYQVLETTVGPALSRQTPAELVATRTLLRGFRDKWRAQTHDQRRRVRADRGGNAQLTAARSDTKQMAFSDALTRVEQQIERVGASGVRPAVKTTTRRGRSTDHRQERATTRKALSRSLDDATSKRAGSGAKRLKNDRPLPKFAAPAAPAATASEVKPLAKALGKSLVNAKSSALPKSSTQPKPTGQPKPISQAKPKSQVKSLAKALKPTTIIGATARSKKNTNTPLALEPNTGRVSGSSAGADAAAKASQLRRGGLRSRTLGHVSAQGRRNQARRDFVNRKES